MHDQRTGATTMSDAGRPTRITHIGTVVIPVRDQEAALRFFRDTFGFEVLLDTVYGPGQRWIEVAPPGAETTIALAPMPDGQPAEIQVSFATEDAEADHHTLRSLGVEADAELLRFGPSVPPMFTFRDPESNAFRVVERMPSPGR
jgi:catechol 2,3-dioxygenase-like lactoylglutathione lyase family enzyme